MLFEGIINHLDSNWLYISSTFYRNKNVDIFEYTPPYNPYSYRNNRTLTVTINWKRNIVSFKDDIFKNAWRFNVNKKGDVYLYKGTRNIGKQDDIGLSVWRGVDKHVSKIILNKIDDTLLNNIS